MLTVRQSSTARDDAKAARRHWFGLHQLHPDKIGLQQAVYSIEHRDHAILPHEDVKRQSEVSRHRPGELHAVAARVSPDLIRADSEMNAPV